jgi:hypothetical protein
VAVSIIGISLALSPASAFAQARPHRSDAVPRQILEQIRRDTAWRPRVERFRDSLAHLLIAEPVDLDRDGIPELVIRGQGRICGTSNCETWIYRRTSTGYERLWGDDIIQRIEPLATMSHGYRDLRSWKHGSAWDSDVIDYEFDGRQYRAMRCANYNYGFKGSDGEIHTLKRPRITPEPC